MIGALIRPEPDNVWHMIVAESRPIKLPVLLIVSPALRFRTLLCIVPLLSNPASAVDNKTMQPNKEKAFSCNFPCERFSEIEHGAVNECAAYSHIDCSTDI